MDKRISFYTSNPDLLPQFSYRDLKPSIQNFHSKYVLVPADKASNNVIIIWRLHYVNVLRQELTHTKAYEAVSIPENDIVSAHVEKSLDFQLTVPITQHKLPTMYWIPKLHKTPYKARFIANSSVCTTTHMSKLLTLYLTKTKDHSISYCDKTYDNSGINWFFGQ